MKTAVLFSGGKDSTYSVWLAKKAGYDVACLITLHSENPHSYMFHTPSIKRTVQQAKVMEIPLLIEKTKGEKEIELKDLERAIRKAKTKYQINFLVTGALHSEYQASRIQKICDKLRIKCLNPLWHKNELSYLQELIDDKFEIVIVGVGAYPLDRTWLGRKIDESFIEDIKKFSEKYKIHVAGEGGEFESFVLNCPLFKKPLKIIRKEITGSENSWKMEIDVK